MAITKNKTNLDYDLEYVVASIGSPEELVTLEDDGWKLLKIESDGRFKLQRWVLK